MKKPTLQHQAQEIDAALDLLFGSEEDLTDAELDEELTALDVDKGALEQKAHKHLRHLANLHFSSLERPVPGRLSAAIRELRPPSAEEKHLQTFALAKQKVQDIFKAVKTPNILPSLAASAVMPAQFSFRNKGELSTTDLELLEGEQCSLNEHFVDSNELSDD